MKKLFFILILFSFQTSYAQWEKTAWQSESPVKIAARDGDRFILTGTSDYSNTDIVKISTDNGVSWKNITPENLNGEVGRVEIIGNTIFFRIWNNGFTLYVSTDLGSSWGDKFPGMSEEDSLIDYEYIDGELIASFTGGMIGVYSSSDAGVTWEKISEGLDGAEVQWFFNTGSSLFAHSNNQFYIYSKNESKWIHKGQIEQFTYIQAYGETKKSIYILNNKGFFASSDLGSSWKNIGENLPELFEPRSLTISGDQIILTSYIDLPNGGENQIYTTSDDGATWTELPNDLIKRSPYALYAYSNKLLLGVEDSLYVSSDEGKNWSFVSNDLPHPSLGWYGLYFADSLIYHVVGNMIYVSQDSGYTWKKWYGGINFSEVTDMVSMDDVLYAVHSGSPDVSSSNASVFASDDFGDSWRPLNIKDKGVYNLFAGDNKLLLTTYNEVYYSTDLGSNWEEIKHVWPDNNEFQFVVFAPDTIYTLSRKGVKVSTTGGQAWTSISSGLPSYDIRIKNFKMAKSEDSYSVLYAMYDSLLYRSTNAGQEWRRIGENLPDMDFDRCSMGVEYNEVYIYTKSAIYYSGDYGETWAERTGGLTLGENKWVNTIKTIGDLTFISIVNDGVYVTEDKGITWKQINGGISNFSYINTFAAAGDYVFCGSATERIGPNGDAIYRAKISDFLSAPEEKEVLTALVVAPNPAGDFISITNYRGADRRYTILNLLGQTMLSGELNGNGIFVSSLPAGAYMIRIGDETGMMLKK